MPIEVELPDGSVAEFPDGTSNDVIKGALQKRFAPKVDPNTGQPPGVPEYVPPGVEGYDPKTGNVAQYSKGRSAAMGAADATTLGFGDELASYLGSAISGVPRDQVLSEMRGNAKAAQQENPGSYLAGQVGGGLAQAAVTGGAGFGANAARAGGTLLKTAIGSAADGALYGGAYGAGSADRGGTDRIVGALTGAGAGAALGGAIPYATSGISKLVRSLITPFSAPAERTAAASLLAQEGIPITAGQRTGSKVLRYAESELGGSKAADIMEKQGEAFTDAAMRRAGGAGRATSDNMADLSSSLGKGFEDIASRNSLSVDQALVTDMNKAAQDYAAVLPTEQKAIFQQLGNDIAARFKAGQGTISGSDYQTIRSRLSRMANSYKARDPEFAGAIRGLRNALDDGMDRSINPADRGAWAELRRQYGNMKTLEKAIAGAGGEEAGAGIISPARLRMATSSGNRGGYARGEGDFADLAKAGQAVMTPLPNSGTAARAAVRNLGFSAGGAGAGYMTTGDYKGALAGAAAPYAAGKMLMSAPVQHYLANQLAKSASNPVREAIISALLRGGALPAIEGR
jgi:hypothetical protein